MSWRGRNAKTLTPEALKAFTDGVMEAAYSRYPRELAGFFGDALIRQTLGEVSYQGDRVRQAIPVRNVMLSHERGNHMFPLRGDPETFTLRDLDGFIRTAPDDLIRSTVLQQLLEKEQEQARETLSGQALEDTLDHLREFRTGESARLMYRNLLEQGRRRVVANMRGAGRG